MGGSILFFRVLKGCLLMFLWYRFVTPTVTPTVTPFMYFTLLDPILDTLIYSNFMIKF